MSTWETGEANRSVFPNVRCESANRARFRNQRRIYSTGLIKSVTCRQKCPCCVLLDKIIVFSRISVVSKGFQC
jgi:hypothetical protein